MQRWPTTPLPPLPHLDDLLLAEAGGLQELHDRLHI